MKMLHVIASAFLAMSTANATAQSYPSRPITLIVPFAAGGPLDTRARSLAEHMRQTLGQAIIIENITGAAGSIGTGRLARAAPDGYTIGIGIWSTHVVAGAIYALSYDLRSDFAPIALLTDNSQLLVGKKALPPDDLKGLIAWLKANPDKALAGTAGVGSPQHVFGVQFQNATGTRFQFVHYRGGAPAAQDLVAGQIDLVISDLTTSLPQVRGGRLKAYAYTGTKRLAVAPDIPTAEEAGMPGFRTSVWSAMWAPKGTPKGIVATLNAAIVDALADEKVGQRMAALGDQIVPRDQQTPEALGALQRAEIEKWWPIIRAANIKMN